MTKRQPPIITYKGRSLGIAVLTAAQIFIGGIHVFFGFLLLAFENLNFIQATIAYDVYTVIFGGLTVIFAVPSLSTFTRQSTRTSPPAGTCTSVV